MKKRIVYLDILKVLACTMVVLLHCNTSAWSSTNPDSIRFLTQNLFSTITRPCVNLFVMVTGALILSSGKKLSVLECVKRSVNFLTLVVLWSAFYMLMNNYRAILSGEFNFFDGIKQALLNPESHLWYLIMLAGLYLLMPFIQVIIKDAGNTLYLIALFVFFDVFKQLFVNALNIDAFNFYYENINISLSYVGYLVLGYYLSTNNFSKKQTGTIYLLGVLSVIGIYAVTQITSVKNGVITTTLYSYFSLPTFLYSAALFVFVKNIGIHLPDNNHKILTALSNYSFGIYLVHIASLRVITKFCFAITDFPAILSIPAMFISVSSTSLLIVYVINKIPILNLIFSTSIFKKLKLYKRT